MIKKNLFAVQRRESHVNKHNKNYYNLLNLYVVNFQVRFE